ncbi:unnamed protein product [Paramecium sonneborni]|uniref:Laminin EGF-like domain-containing protein n=1 Tax=Paramecium sonneborni TaxID=65129 RepID=A0A8S1RJ13_9CILI|nr:unnamed protein product [Paramecium sonneborni]
MMLLIFQLNIKIVKSSCDVFKVLTTPENESRQIFQDLWDETNKDYSWGVWTKYLAKYEPIEDLELKIKEMHVQQKQQIIINNNKQQQIIINNNKQLLIILSESFEKNNYLVYYIVLDKEELQIYHKLFINQNNNVEIRELKVAQELVKDNWVFFYFCYSQPSQVYNIFLYINSDRINVQMVQGGPFQSQNNGLKIYQLGGIKQFSYQITLKQEMRINLSQFSGEITDKDLRIGIINFYKDISTFLQYIEDPSCKQLLCTNTMIEEMITMKQFLGETLKYQVSYKDQKFMIYGWVKLHELENLSTVQSVLMRVSLRKTYFNDLYQGDKAFYWEYLQSNQNNEQNGITITTYHNDPFKPLSSYQTFDTDSWIVKGSYYQQAITFWHWFVYQEGINQINNIKLLIYFGSNQQTQTFTMMQNHFEKSSLYFTIGGDKFNKNFRGDIQNLTIQYCYTLDTPKIKICHYSCKSCYGPEENQCILCDQSQRTFNKGACKCKPGYIDNKDKGCQSISQLITIEIQEANLLDNTHCKLGQFSVQFYGKFYCLACPGQYTTLSLNCIECISNPIHWYLNPICKSDYFQPLQDQSDYVFLETQRNQIYYQYYLINQLDITQNPIIEICQGCLGLITIDFNFIENYQLNILSRFACKTCYTVINGECININQHCLNCDSYFLCSNCFQNYTLFDGHCYQCPYYCPNCKFNQTGTYCQNCISGYYYNSTQEQCIQCGQFCSICIYNQNLPFLQCIKCIDEKQYFISADRQMCRKKNLDHCVIQGEEYVWDGFSNFSDKSLNYYYASTIDIQAIFTSQETFQVCILCEDQYVNKLALFSSNECVHASDTSKLPDLKDELKNLVLASENYSYQLSFSNWAGQATNYTVIYGKPTTLLINNYSNRSSQIYYNFSSVVLSVNFKYEDPLLQCTDPHCIDCIKNYVLSQEFCIKCQNGYYASAFTGLCYQCKENCKECLEQHSIYQDAWKWQIIPYYQFRSNIFYGFHNYNLYCISTDNELYEQICTKCKGKDALHNGKCYKDCNCEECIFQEGQNKCLRCKSSQTYINGECIQCPNYCDVCKQLTNQEIYSINPYFNPNDIKLYRFAKQCLEVYCLNNQNLPCYKYAQKTLNVYCNQDVYFQDYSLLTDENQKFLFLDQNIPLNEVFSLESSSHFSNQENDVLFDLFNEKSVKLMRYILKIKQNSGQCQIQDNTFVYSTLRKNIFMLQSLELIFQSNLDIPIYFGNNITFQQFTSITFQNILFDSLSGPIQIFCLNLQDIKFNLQHFHVVNGNNLQLQFIIQNPSQIDLQQVTLKNTQFVNIYGFICYYFTQPKLIKQLVISINDFIIQDSQLLNTYLIIQILNTNYGNQQLKINGLQSLNNYYTKSSLIYTSFLNQIRQSEIIIENFLSDTDQLIQSSFLELNGALNVLMKKITIQNGKYKKEVNLFKLPLFQIYNLNIINNNFMNVDNRVLTNILDSLYADNILENRLILNSIYFINNSYVGNNVFLELISSNNFVNLNIEIDDLILESNQFKVQPINKSKESIVASNASIYFDTQKLTLKNTKIIRSFNLPEISINNADLVEVSSFNVSLNQKYQFKSIHSQISCFDTNKEIGYGSIILFYNIKKLIIAKVLFKNLISINTPLLLIKSLERTNFRVQESIIIIDHIYINNRLIITKQSQEVAILSFISEQEQIISLDEINGNNNILHCFQEDQKFSQSSTILVLNPYSYTTLQNSVFYNNIVTASLGSNLIIFSKSLILQNTQFYDQNILNYDSLKYKLIWGYSEDEQIFLEHLENEFAIKSKGGNGFLSAEEIYIMNITTNNSMASQGGSFYISTVSDGIVQINNSKFAYSQSNLLFYDKSQGGTLFIDASQSMLQFQLYNCTIFRSSSRKEGGVFFIEPSRTQNLIILESNIVQEIYSLYYPFLKLPIQFTSKTLILNIDIIQTYVNNSYDGYFLFYGKVRQLTKSEISNAFQNSLISIDGGNIVLEDVQFTNIFQFGIMNIKNANQVYMTNVSISFITLINDNLILINSNTKYQTSIKFINVELELISEFSKVLTYPKISILLLQERINRCLLNSQTPQVIKEFYDSKQLELFSNNNFYNIIIQYQKPTFIIGIDSVSNNHKLFFNQLKLHSINCQSCHEGIFTITNIDVGSQKNNLIQLKQFNIFNNQCGQLGCIFVSNKDKRSLKLFSSEIKNRYLAETTQLSELTIFPIKIEDSRFYENEASYGGGLIISGVSTLINNCQFTNNSANISGGSIYFDYKENTEILIVNSIFANNNAKIGGAIFLGNYSINSPKILNNSFFNNKALIFGQNQADQPIKLLLQIGDKILETVNVISDMNNITDKIKIDQYKLGNISYNYIMIPSGQSIGYYQIFDEDKQQYVSYNYSFRIIPLNNENGQVKSLDGSKCTIYGRKVLNKEIGQFDQNLTSFTEINFNTSTQDYNLDQLIIKFDPDLNQFGYIQIEIICNSIKIPQFSTKPPYLLQNYFTNYRLWIDFQTFNCQRGEYKTDNGECKLCESSKDQYTVIAGQRCKIKDQIKMEKVSPARIMLRPEYWRPSENNENIEYCLNVPKNCVGGWNPGNDLCDYAHIGALCEQCDIYNVRGQGFFSITSSYKCGNCQEVGDNSIKISLISLWTMISIFLSVRGTIQGVEKIVAQYKMSKLKLKQFDQKAGYGGILVKVLTNYFQIIAAVSLFQLELSSALQSSIRSVGNPVEAMSYSLDCFLIRITDINIIYFRMIWALIMPLLYILAFALIYIIAVILNITQSNKSAITTTAIYLFTYLQPTLLGGFISLLSFRRISDIYWIQGNVAYRYLTQQHFQWITAFVLPSTLILAFIIPIYMLLSLYYQRYKLEEEKTRKNWGYLYNEYQHKAYFWEIIKIFQKGFMIMFLTLYEDQIIIKAALIFIIVFIYQILTKKYRPYKSPYLNFLDEISTIICGTSIVMGMTIYQANKSDNQEIIWPFYILLILINAIFIIIILWEILWAQIQDNQDKLDNKIRNKINNQFPNLKNKNVLFYRLLTNRREQQQRIQLRYLKIKEYLMNIVRKNPGIYQQPIFVSMNKQIKNIQFSELIFQHAHLPAQNKDIQNQHDYPRTSKKIYPIMNQENNSDFQESDSDNIKYDEN